MRSPFVARAKPSTMLTATRSVRAMIGRIPRQRGRVEQAVLGKADDELGALALEQLGDAVGDDQLRVSPHRSDRVGDLSGRPPHHVLGRDGHAGEAGQPELVCRRASGCRAAERRRRPGRSSTPSSTSTKFACDGTHAEPARASSSVEQPRGPRRPRRARVRDELAAARSRRRPAASATRLTLNGSCTMSSSRATSGSAERVAEPQTREAEDLRERAQDDHGAPGEHVLLAAPRAPRVGEVDVRLVGDDDAVGRQPVEERGPRVGRDQRAGRVVRIADPDEPRARRVGGLGDRRRDRSTSSRAGTTRDRGAERRQQTWRYRP